MINEQFIDRVINILLEMRLDEVGAVKRANKERKNAALINRVYSRDPLKDPQGLDHAKIIKRTNRARSMAKKYPQNQPGGPIPVIKQAHAHFKATGREIERQGGKL